MRISRQLVDEMIVHALEDRPTSAADDRRARRGGDEVIPVSTRRQPLRYEMDPQGSSTR